MLKGPRLKILKNVVRAPPTPTPRATTRPRTSGGCFSFVRWCSLFIIDVRRSRAEILARRAAGAARRRRRGWRAGARAGAGGRARGALLPPAHRSCTTYFQSLCHTPSPCDFRIRKRSATEGRNGRRSGAWRSQRRRRRACSLGATMVGATWSSHRSGRSRR
jgi:hypothetical protein